MKTDELKFLFSTILFGTNPIISRFINVSSFFLSACRGVTALIFMLVILKIKGLKINIESIKHNLLYLVLSGLSMGFMWIFVYTGYRYCVSITSLINNTAPIFVVVISAFLYKDKLSLKQILCVVFVFIGVLFVSGVFEDTLIADYHGLLYGFLSCICFCSMVLLNKKMKDIVPLDKTIAQIFVSMLVTSIFSLITKTYPSSIDTKSIILIFELGMINTGFAYLLYFDAISTLPAYKIAIIGYLEPVITILLGIIILHEQLSLLGILGAIIILVSTYISET